MRSSGCRIMYPHREYETSGLWPECGFVTCKAEIRIRIATGHYRIPSIPIGSVGGASVGCCMGSQPPDGYTTAIVAGEPIKEKDNDRYE